MNEQSVKQFNSDEREEAGCCLRCRWRRRCVKRLRRQLKKVLSDLFMFGALNNVTYNSAQRMVGG